MKSFYTILITSAFASNFVQDVGHQRRCSDPSTLAKVDTKFPKLNECYPKSPFFSPLSVLCSKKCLDVTSKAAKFVSDGCSVGKSNDPAAIFGSPISVYNLWSNKKANQVVCAKGKADNYCLNELYDYQFNKYNPTFVLSSEVCTDCMKNIYNQFKSDPYAVPQVHTTPIYNPVEVFKYLNQLCRFD